MPNSILVPIDGTPDSGRALPFAAWLQRATGAKITLVRALPTLNRAFITNASAQRIAQERQREEARQAEEETRAIAERLRTSGVTLSVVTRAGPPESIILEEANAHGADLITMFTHGRSGTTRFLFGSIADQILMRGKAPVLVIPPGSFAEWPAEPDPRRMLVPLDGSPVAEAVIPAALDLARALSAEITLLHATPSGAASGADEAYLETRAAALREQGMTVLTRSLPGSPAATIARLAQDEGVHVIAMATHGRGGLARAIAGSVTTAVVREAPAPVLVVRPPAMSEGQRD